MDGCQSNCFNRICAPTYSVNLGTLHLSRNRLGSATAAGEAWQCCRVCGNRNMDEWSFGDGSSKRHLSYREHAYRPYFGGLDSNEARLSEMNPPTDVLDTEWKDCHNGLPGPELVGVTFGGVQWRPAFRTTANLANACTVGSGLRTGKSRHCKEPARYDRMSPGVCRLGACVIQVAQQSESHPILGGG